MADLQKVSAPSAQLWTEAERAAWRPAERLRPSQWTERYRVLDKKRSSRPGPWRNANQPILAPLMDLAVRRAVLELWIQKCAQFGGSEVSRNVLGYLAHQKPTSVLYVLPNKEQGRKQSEKYLRPVFTEECQVLSELVYRADNGEPDKTRFKLTNIQLQNGFDLQLGWGGSAASLASEPRKVVFLDEVDKFEPFVGAEASAPDLARNRQHTYGNSRMLIGVSTPTNTEGLIYREREACPIQLRYYVHCPHTGCQHPHSLDWDNVRFTNFKGQKDGEGVPLTPKQRAALLRAQKAAHMICPGCGGKITDADKRAMLFGGFWGTPDLGWRLWYDGRETGEKPPGDAVGVRFSRLYDVVTTFAEVAAKFVEAEGDLSATIDFWNGWMGEPFRDLSTRVETGAIARKCLPSDRWEPPQAELGFVPQKRRLRRLPLYARIYVSTAPAAALSPSSSPPAKTEPVAGGAGSRRSCHGG